MKISIQQPECFPWLGFFNKIVRVDKVVILDSVQFKKRYFENRNRITGDQQPQWVTIPVISKGRYTQNIADVEIDNETRWQKKISATITQQYQKSPCWNDLGPELIKTINEKHFLNLVDFNMSIIRLILKKLEIKKEIIFSSSLNIQKSGSELIVAICEEMRADSYLSGNFGRDYLSFSSFEEKNINLEFQDYVPPIYPQFNTKEFVPSLSIIDALFNIGAEQTYELLTMKKI